ELVTPGGNAAAHAADRARPHEEFRALQDQLRATIGGAAAEIGGAADLNAPRGTFQGTPLFGPGPAVRPGSSGDAYEQLALPEINLRSGAMLSLIRQEESGAYRVHPDDAGIASLLSTAAQEVATAHAS